MKMKKTFKWLLKITACLSINLINAQTTDLTTHLVSATPPSGATLEWHNALPIAAGNVVATPTAVGQGVYYGVYNFGTCYSSPSPIRVATNACPATTLDLSTLVDSTNKPSGTVVTYHSAYPVSAANRLTNATVSTANTYFTAYMDVANACFSESSPIVFFTSSCCANPSIGGTAAYSGGTMCSTSNVGTAILSSNTGSVVRWETSTNSGTTWSPLTSTATYYNFTNAANAQQYRAVVNNGSGCADAYSAPATIATSPANCTSASCDNTTGNVTINVTTPPSLSTYSSKLIMTNASGVIQYVSAPSSSTINGVATGDYLVYRVLYDSTQLPLPTLTVGTNIMAIGGGCTKFTNQLAYKVCPCPSGTTAPSVSASTLSNACPATTANLGSITASNKPSGTVISWHTATPATSANKVADSSVVGTGTYYATFRDPATNCLANNGAATTAVTVTINGCTLLDSLEYTIKYNATTLRYEAYAKPRFTSAAFTGVDGFFTIVVPSSVPNSAFPVLSNPAFNASVIDNYQHYGPTTSYPNSDVHTFKLSGATTSGFTANTEKLLFTFTLPTGTPCVSGVRLFNNNTDPNSQPDMGFGDFANYFTNISNGKEYYANNYGTPLVDAACPCLGGSTAPILTATTKSNTCPVLTVNLSTITATNKPSGTVLTWHTGSTPTAANKVADSSAVTTVGTYYAAFNDAANACYSTASTAVTVTKTLCTTTPSVTTTTGTTTTGNATTELNPTGGNAPYTYSNGAGDAACVAPGGASALPAGSNFTVNSNGTYSYTAPATAGTYYYCIKVCDNTSPTPICKTTTYTLTVSLSNAPDLTTTVGQPSPVLIAGQPSNIPVTVANIGTASATGPITTTITLPTGVTAPTNFTSNGWTCSTSTPSVTCTNAGSIAAGSNKTFNVPVTPNATTVGTTPTFNATTAPVTGEVNTSNNNATPLVANPAVQAASCDWISGGISK